MMTPPNLKVTIEDEIAFVDFEDEDALDVLSVQRVGQELFSLVEKPPAGTLVLDFQRIRNISSQALGLFLTMRRQAEANGVTLALVGLRAELRRAFETAKLDRLFTFLPDRQAARDRFGRSASESAES